MKVLYSIRWRIALPYMLLIVAVMAFMVFYVSAFMRNVYLDNLREQLVADGRLIGDALMPYLAQGVPPTAFASAAARYARLLDADVAIVGATGSILGYSWADSAGQVDPSSWPEVQQASTAGEGSSVRFNERTGQEMMHVALRVVADERTVGFVRLALPLSQVDAQVQNVRRAILFAALIATVIAGLLAVGIAERTARPVRELTAVAERMAGGDLNARLLLNTYGEVGQLVHAFNHMVDQLREKVASLADQRGRLAAVLDGMAGGVIMTDGEGRVQLMNPAAAQLLDTTEERALGMSLAQVVRHHQLIALWQRCRMEGQEQSAAVEVSYRHLFLQAIVRPFQQEDVRYADSAGARGYLLILQDLTHIRRLETVRRDFISNISHELRTPLAGLKALVETIRDGALDDPPAARRFLDRMDVEVDALTQMVEELLELSRIESGKRPVRLKATAVSELVQPPVERLQPQAERARLTVHLDVPRDLPDVLADAERVQRVVTNLVHNAIKFTPAGGHVWVSGRAVRVSGQGRIEPETLALEAGTLPPGDWVLVAVQDTGIGIRSEDLARIFERFYKVDRARSGGGTGLGLAIAKHIVQSHGGRIWAASVEGRGSTFYFSLPVV
jgi:two-component system phosphate regulon sensor histidine kinase PhoR